MRSFDTTHLTSSTIGWLRRYENHISAVSLAGGFAFDSWAFGQIDRPETQAVFIVYLLVAGIAIAVLHGLESRPEERRPSDRVRAVLIFTTQFALGCLLSGFCVFYIRSASLTSSWPFLLALMAIFIGNEYLRRYHSRLVFAALLFFFSLYSYAILLVPLVVQRIGKIPFLISGVIAVVIFAIYMRALAQLGHERYRGARMQVAAGMVLITLFLNAAYFLKLLPPLPLVLTDAGVYHSVERVQEGYRVASEQEPPEWEALFGTFPLLHIQHGARIYIYNSVFAPRGLETLIVHDWQWRDPKSGGWISQQRVVVNIVGGRQDGYRWYTYKTGPRPGQWRVNIEAADGRSIGRVRFAVEEQAVPPALTMRIIKGSN
jgi:hypothetical protein